MSSRIKSSINYPVNLYDALRRIHKKDITGRTFNQVVLDLLYSTKDVKEELKRDDSKNVK